MDDEDTIQKVTDVGFGEDKLEDVREDRGWTIDERVDLVMWMECLGGHITTLPNVASHG